MVKTKLFQEHPKSNQDNRIDNGKAIDELLKSKGWELIAKRLSDLRDEAHVNLLLVSGSAIGDKWRHRLTSFDEALGIPNEFIIKAKIAQQEE